MSYQYIPLAPSAFPADSVIDFYNYAAIIDTSRQMPNFSPALASDAQPQAEENCESDEKTADDSLLKFHPEHFTQEALLNPESEQTTVSLTGRLHGLFNLIHPWAVATVFSADGSAPKIQLGFYKRNMVQITGRLSVARDLTYIWTPVGQQIRISQLQLAVSCEESTENSPVELLTVVGKSDSDTGTTDTKPIPIDLANARGNDPDYVDVTFEWKRLRFKMSTANNGRRPDLQQTFTVHVNLQAYLVTGELKTLVQVKTHDIVVRARSPGNFREKKDKPIMGTHHHVRKQLHRPAHQARKRKQSLAREPSSTVLVCPD